MPWKTVLEPITSTPYYKTLMQKVNLEYQKYTVYPPKADLFKAFKITPFDALKVVILGQDPYHQPMQAMGLAFSVPKQSKIPPSLVNIYKELKNDLNMALPSHGDLTGWASQGVLLLNTVLTVRENQPTSHKAIGWERFTDDVIRALNDYPRPLVYLLWGNHARSKKRLINADKHCILEASHPSPLGAHVSFHGCRHFSTANAFLVKHGITPIDFSYLP